MFYCDKIRSTRLNKTPRVVGKGGKNRRRGKNENENDKRELVFRDDGQGTCFILTVLNITHNPLHQLKSTHK